MSDGLTDPIEDLSTSRSSTSFQMLGVYIGDEVFCIDVSYVQEVILYAKPTPLKNLPSFVKGLLSIRGKMVPVIDLAEVLDLGPTPLSIKSAIILIHFNDLSIGMIVREIFNLIWIDREACVDVPDTLSNVKMSVIEFAIPRRERLFFALDIEEVITTHLATVVKKVVKHDKS